MKAVEIKTWIASLELVHIEDNVALLKTKFFL